MLKVAETESTPHVLFDESKSIFEISGASYPENASKFYKPILEWIDFNGKWFKSGSKWKFYFEYISSSSHKMVYEILCRLDTLHKSGKKISIIWLYDDEEDDIVELGEDYASLVSLPFEIIPKVNLS